ncbi:MAG: DEAD/DEAH box helicase [Thermoplasmata archaeon]|nr:DEAD/DEAH box helicase [Thermoplasmata archaeon]
MGSVEHPRVRPLVLEERLYQDRISKAAVGRNTLVVLPTGLGKTAIALRTIAEFLLRDPTRSILFLAPTRPLVVQHARSVETTLFAPEPLVLTGSISPARRQELLHPPQVVVATPQVVGNDLASAEFDLSKFSLIIFDEAHRAVGDYPYVTIGRANRDGPDARVLAMTASPGARIERIREVWNNLGIEQFEYRTAHDPDVQPYVHGIGVETVEVRMPPEVRHLAIEVKQAVGNQTRYLHQHGFLASAEGSRRDLLALGERLRQESDRFRRSGGHAPAALWGAITSHAIAMKATHALELIESQGVEALRAFLEKQEVGPKGRPTPSSRGFLSDPSIVRVREILRSLTLEHPKIEKAVEVVRQELGRSPEARIILFAQYRQTAELLVTELEKLGDPGIRPARFVGQATHGDDTGLTQKEQIGLLDSFRNRAVNVLVATSVAEEGLDIPATDLVIFYEPVPDVIRTIQRRGRTGRSRAGRAVVLVAEGTRDVGMDRASRSKEKRMHDMLERVAEEAQRGPLRPPPAKPPLQTSLEEFGPN